MDRFVIVTSCCSNKYLYHMKYDDGDENNLHLRECSSAEQATRARERVVMWLSSGSESDYDPNDE